MRSVTLALILALPACGGAHYGAFAVEGGGGGGAEDGGNDGGGDDGGSNGTGGGGCVTSSCKACVVGTASCSDAGRCQCCAIGVCLPN